MVKSIADVHTLLMDIAAERQIPVPMTCKAARGISVAEKFFCGDDITHIKAS